MARSYFHIGTGTAMIRRTRATLWLLVLAAVLWPALQGCVAPKAARGHLVIGVGDSDEQRLLGELSLSVLRDAGYQVDMRRDLGSPWMVRKAVEAGSIDLAWDYTGRVWRDELGHDQALTDPDNLYRRLRDEDALNGLTWVVYAPAEDRLVLVMPEALAKEARLRSISDLAYHLDNLNPDLVLCTTAAINESAYGPAALRRVYAARFKPANIREMSAADALTGLRTGVCHGALAPASAIPAAAADLRLLWDDRDLMPASNLAPVVRSFVVRDHPELASYLRRLCAALDRATLAGLRQQVAEGKRPDRVARQFLRANDVVSTPTPTITPTQSPTPTGSAADGASASPTPAAD